MTRRGRGNEGLRGRGAGACGAPWDQRDAGVNAEGRSSSMGDGMARGDGLEGRLEVGVGLDPVQLRGLAQRTDARPSRDAFVVTPEQGVFREGQGPDAALRRPSGDLPECLRISALLLPGADAGDIGHVHDAAGRSRRRFMVAPLNTSVMSIAAQQLAHCADPSRTSQTLTACRLRPHRPAHAARLGALVLGGRRPAFPSPRSGFARHRCSMAYIRCPLPMARCCLVRN